jgi:hypothetical protein
VSSGIDCANKLTKRGAGVNLQGSILLGACSGYYGDPLGTTGVLGEQHGFVFFRIGQVSVSSPVGVVVGSFFVGRHYVLSVL